MQRPQLELTAEDGYEALRGHLVDRALAARAAHGPVIDADAIAAVLADPDVVRFPTRLVFDAEPLLAGEFAVARPRTSDPREGFDLVVHPCFEQRPDVLPLLVAYHVPSINYLDVATHVEAELFGAALLGMEVDDYYERLCELADGMPGAAPPSAEVTAAMNDLERARLEAAVAEAARAERAPAPGGCAGACTCGGTI